MISETPPEIVELSSEIAREDGDRAKRLRAKCGDERMSRFAVLMKYGDPATWGDAPSGAGTMSEPKRYKRLDGEYTGMGVDGQGKWVKYEDHVVRVAELKGDVRRMCNAIVQYQKAHANSLNGKCSEGSLSSVRCDLFESIEAEAAEDGAGT